MHDALRNLEKCYFCKVAITVILSLFPLNSIEIRGDITCTLLIYMMRCAIWYHLYNLKNLKNPREEVLYS